MLYLVIDEASNILSTETDILEATKTARKYRDKYGKSCAVFKALEVARYDPLSYPERRPLSF